VRQILGKITVPERRFRTPAACRNQRRIVPGAAGSGERFHQPCGDAGGEKGEEGRGECGLLIGSVRGRNGRVLTRIEEEN
jgi:hypothetical protein